jgi:hypothetical protein
MDVVAPAVRGAFLNLHRVFANKAAQEINQRTFIVVQMKSFSPFPTLSETYIARLCLAVPSAGGFEGQPVADFNTIRVYSSGLELTDVQKHIRSAPSTPMNPKPRSAFHIFNLSAANLFPLRLQGIPQLTKTT